MTAAWIGLIGSVIVGLLTLAGVVYQSNKQADRFDASLEKEQAVTNVKLEELTREVREHNNFARRMPVIEEQIKTINQRLDGLEKGA